MLNSQRMRPSPRIPANPDLAGLFASRGRLDAHRYLEMKDVQDLDNAISNMRIAVSLFKDTQSANLGRSLGNLAALLLEQFKSTGKDVRLNEARQLATWAMECLSDCDVYRAYVLTTLGNILSSEYDLSGRTQDLEEAISSLWVATQARSPPDDSIFPAVMLNNLSCVLEKRYKNTGRKKDLNDAVTRALEATEVNFSNQPSLMAGIGSTLASLLLRQYKATGQLDSLINALFELRIVTEIAPDYSKLDTLLGQLGSLVREQHTLRAPQMDPRIEVSQLLNAKSLILFLFVFLLTVFSVFILRGFYPLVVFFGGIMFNWVSQEYYQQITSRDKPSYLLDVIPIWIQERFSSSYDITRFTPTLFPTPWIDTSSTLTLTKSEEVPYNEDTLRKQKSIYATRLQSGYDEGRINRAGIRYPTYDKDHLQNNTDALHREINQIPIDQVLHKGSDSSAFSTTNDYEGGLENQNQLLYGHLAHSNIWEDVNDSPNDSEPPVAPRSTSEEGKVVKQVDEVNGHDTSILTRRISTNEGVVKTVMVPCPKFSGPSLQIPGHCRSCEIYRKYGETRDNFRYSTSLYWACIQTNSD